MRLPRACWTKQQTREKHPLVNLSSTPSSPQTPVAYSPRQQQKPNSTFIRRRMLAGITDQLQHYGIMKTGPRFQKACDDLQNICDAWRNREDVQVIVQPRENSVPVVNISEEGIAMPVATTRIAGRPLNSSDCNVRTTNSEKR
ncbi:hypothetical protein QAD02_018443 [Eretmocerus hayati]|uniref:Uncharacterized protein n=1 Tax=Eretmocerus hayati TaxID=131215 RepID=A0ACC2PI12_9HYME|nr:hypothetical protein QAD02_018443 [Eretmocerus hayati]